MLLFLKPLRQLARRRRRTEHGTQLKFVQTRATPVCLLSLARVKNHLQFRLITAVRS